MLNYCQQKVAKPGSDLYYSLLRLPEEKKNAIIAIHAFAAEVLPIALLCQEQQVAAQKMAWWQQQLDALFDSKQTQHPVAQSLEPAVKQFQLPKQLFDEVIEAAKLKLEYNHCCSEKDFQLYAYREQGIVQILSCIVLTGNKSQHLQFAQQLANALCLAEMIIHFRQAIIDDQVYFPLEDLEQYKLTHEVLHKMDCNQQMQDFLKFQQLRCEGYFNKAFELIDKQDKTALRQMITLARLKKVALTERMKSANTIFTHKVELTPLRKLLTAWLNTTSF